MSAVEEIQRAIATLTAERNAAEDGPFVFLKYDGDQYDMGDIVMGDPSDPVEAYPLVAQQVHRADATLHITLHRTIDAQLAILEYELVFAKRGHTPPDHILTLARAINGDAS